MIPRVLNTPPILFILRENLGPKIIHITLQYFSEPSQLFLRYRKVVRTNFAHFVLLLLLQQGLESNLSISRKLYEEKLFNEVSKNFIFLVYINENLQNNCFLYILRPKICRKPCTNGSRYSRTDQIKFVEDSI